MQVTENKIDTALAYVLSKAKLIKKNPKTIVLEYEWNGKIGVETLGKYKDSSAYFTSATSDLPNGKKWYSYASYIERDVETNFNLTFSEYRELSEKLYFHFRNK